MVSKLYTINNKNKHVLCANHRNTQYALGFSDYNVASKIKHSIKLSDNNIHIDTNVVELDDVLFGFNKELIQLNINVHFEKVEYNNPNEILLIDEVLLETFEKYPINVGLGIIMIDNVITETEEMVITRADMIDAQIDYSKYMDWLKDKCI